MTRNWQNYNSNQVRTQTENGSRLVLDFAKDYEEKFNQKLSCLNCESKFNKEFLKYIKTMATKDDQKKDEQFVLKKKYNGLPLGFGSRERAFNGKITKKQGEYLLAKHPRGKDLFEKIPSGAEADLSKLKVTELKELAKNKGLEFDDNIKKDELVEMLS